MDGIQLVMHKRGHTPPPQPISFLLIGGRVLICIIAVILFRSNHTVYGRLNSEWLTGFITQSETMSSSITTF